MTCRILRLKCTYFDSWRLSVCLFVRLSVCVLDGFRHKRLSVDHEVCGCVHAWLMHQFVSRECKFCKVVGHYAQFYCSLGSDTRHSGEVIGGEGCCVLAPDWSTS